MFHTFSVSIVSLNKLMLTDVSLVEIAWDLRGHIRNFEI